MKLTDELPRKWQMVLFAPSLLAMVIIGLWPRVMNDAGYLWMWMVLNVGCSLATAIQSTAGMTRAILRWPAAVFVGALFVFMNVFVSFFGGCCAANVFQP